jgi:hypothetical protein
MGYGVKDGFLSTIPTLKRRTDREEIIKRDDSTVIVNNEVTQSKWIKYYEGTEYNIES